MERRVRLRLVVGAAGYGKSAALRDRYGGPDASWYRDGDVDRLLDGGLAKLAAESEQVVIDDLPRLTTPAAEAFRQAVADLPDPVTVTVASRWPLPPAGTDRHPRLTTTLVGPADLRLSEERVARLLGSEYGLGEPALARHVWTVTAGWPALVRLAAETLLAVGATGRAVLPVLTEPDGALARYVSATVLADVPVQLVRLLADAADLAPVTPGVCRALGNGPAAAQVPLLSAVGLLSTAGIEPESGPRPVPVVAAVAGHGRRPVSRQRLGRAAAWYDRHGPPRAAAQAYRLAGDPARCAAVLDRAGDRMVVTGRPAAVAELVTELPEELRTRRLWLLAGDALRTAGDVAAAAQAYQRVAGAEPAGDPGLAWRTGLIHYLRGDQPAALACFAAAQPDRGTIADRALVLAWAAAARARSGDAAAGVRDARRAYRLATGPDGDPALATTHISLALCLGLVGDQVGSEEHYELALQIAERDQDLVVLARILVNRSYHLIGQARYPDGLEAAGRAVRYADAAGHANLHALATGNEADALTMLGRFDEAVQRYTWVLHRYRRMGSRISATALVGLAEVYRLRGWREQARAAAADAARLAERGDSRELLVRALAGAALATMPDDPAEAARLAAEAVRHASDDLRVPALLADGWVALAGERRETAADRADEAMRCARAAGQRAALAGALELRAAAEADPGRARVALREAAAIWTDAGAVVHAARTGVALGRLAGATADDRSAAVIAADRLAQLDVPVDPYLRGGPATDRAAGVELRTLGRFEVWVAGRPVPPVAWQSRRARDLVRILVTRRGRPVPRAELCELLWPDDDPARTGHRLSVLLSIVRTVLDPQRAFAADHYLSADAAGVGLNNGNLRVDVEDFLAVVGHGRRLLDQGDIGSARTILTAAVAGYPADVFEDEPYVDWSQALREQARAAYLDALRMLAATHRAANEIGAAVDCLLRLLAADPYDEPAHRAIVRTLVAGGRHGEARRAFARYGAAMGAIGVPAPDGAILRPPAAVAQPPAGQPVSSSTRRSRSR